MYILNIYIFYMYLFILETNSLLYRQAAYWKPITRIIEKSVFVSNFKKATIYDFYIFLQTIYILKL